jgi:glutathione S-transferase
VIEHDGFILGDSTAICTWLDRLHPEPPVYPRSARELAQVLALEAYAGERLFRTVVRVLFHETFVHPRLHNIPTDPAVVQQVLGTALPEVFGRLDRAAAGGYLVGGALSAADLAVVSNLLTFQYFGFQLDRGAYRNLARLFDQVTALPPVREALRAEVPFVESMGLSGEVPRRLAA